MPRESGPVGVRHRDTNKFETRPHNAPTTQMEDRVLHYVGWDCTRICRCSDLRNHWERTTPVAKRSKYLNAGLTSYMNRHNLTKCSISEYSRWNKLREEQWKEQGVDVDDFHYANAEKSLVCRCKRPSGHDCGTPQHPEIIERCAEFFHVNRDTMEVSRREWRNVDGDTPPPYGAEAPPMRENPPQLQLRSGAVGDNQVAQPRNASRMRVRNKNEPPALRFPREQKRPIAQQDPEVPPRVWHNARPSTWRGRNGVSSAVSTPLGTTFLSPTDRQNPGANASSSQYLASHNVSIHSAASTHWSEIERNAGIRMQKPKKKTQKLKIAHGDTIANAGPIRGGIESIPIGKLPHRDPNQVAPLAYQKSNTHDLQTTYDTEANGYPVCEEDGSSRSGSLSNADGQFPNSFGYDNYLQEKDSEPSEKENEYHWHNPYAQVPYGFEDHPNLFSTPSIELPVNRRLTELSGDAPRQRHTQTLNSLEGRDSDTASELEVKVKRSSAQLEASSKRMSNNNDKSEALSSLIEQALKFAGSSMHDQDEYLRRVTLRTQESNAPVKNCQQCGQPPHSDQEPILTFPGCHHSVHQTCLLKSFREADQEYGKCPVCHMTLCKRTLWNRVEDDREAIFGSQFTALQPPLFVRLPKRSEYIESRSEEVAAAAQLRIIKDYVAVHTEEIIRLWEANRAEPDWFTGVVQPAVNLFLGWRPLARSRLFPCHETFLRLVAWAELVRLMNMSRMEVRRTRGEGAMFPQLGELYRKFDKIRKRYDVEKQTWGMDMAQIVSCEKIALHVVALAKDSCLKNKNS